MKREIDLVEGRGRRRRRVALRPHGGEAKAANDMRMVKESVKRSGSQIGSYGPVAATALQ